MGTGDSWFAKPRSVQRDQRLGTLCRGKVQCNLFCKYNIDRCKNYCRANPKNSLCLKPFAFERVPKPPEPMKPITTKPASPTAQKLPVIPVSVPKPKPRMVEVLPWVEGTFTQPAPLEKILIKHLGTFGSHQGGHPEGLDHEWINIEDGMPVSSWADGTVQEVRQNGDNLDIFLDYGDGLIGQYMGMKTPLVKKGERVKAGQAVAIGEKVPWTRIPQRRV